MSLDRSVRETMLSGCLGAACRLFALSGGAILAALTLLVLISVIGRALGKPIQGDFELVQVGCAVALAFFFPYCQWRRANIIVDFFTARRSPRTRATLDAFGALLLAIVMGVIAWRCGIGAAAIKAANETTMIMGVPLWFAYALMAPAFALASIVGLHSVASSWRLR